jgi:hypothetical protein
MLITYIKGGTPAQIFLERGSAMTRATFGIFWPKLSSFIDWCYTQVSYTGSWESLVFAMLWDIDFIFGMWVYNDKLQIKFTFRSVQWFLAELWDLDFEIWSNI